MAEATIIQILDARDKRVKKQHNILEKYKCPIVSFTMNIAGPEKISPLIERGFYEGINLLKQALDTDSILFESVSTDITGCEAMFSVKTDAPNLKKTCTLIEENSSLGRLFDMDVIDTDGKKLERKSVRGCIVCGAPGRECAAGRLHSVEELQKTTSKILKNYFLDHDKKLISELAEKSLLEEVYTTPKPGLVDCRNSGSHKDMDINTFIKSADALSNYFGECFYLGVNTSDTSPEDTFSSINKIGIEAEELMYSVTGGINTHKGVIYSMGILCAAIGRLWRPELPFSDIYQICSESAKIARKQIHKDFKDNDLTTAGKRIYKNTGITGIRGEVLSEFASVIKIALPCYRQLLGKNFDAGRAGAITLLNLIATVKDTNLYNRGGVKGAEFAMETAKEFLKKNPEPETKQIEALDDAFIERNLSPGGCADLLALTYFLYSIETNHL